MKKSKKNHQIVTEGIFYVLWYSDIHKIMRWWGEFSYHLDHCRACTSSPLDPNQCPVLTPSLWIESETLIAEFFVLLMCSLHCISDLIEVLYTHYLLNLFEFVFQVSIKHKWTHTQVCFNSFLHSNTFVVGKIWFAVISVKNYLTLHTNRLGKLKKLQNKNQFHEYQDSVICLICF